MKDYLEVAYQLKDALEKDERIILLNRAEEEMAASEEVMTLTYNKDLKESYLSDALRHFDKNSIEVRKARLEYFHAHERLDSHPLVKSYLEAYYQVEKLLKDINNILFKDFKGITHEGCRR